MLRHILLYALRYVNHNIADRNVFVPHAAIMLPQMICRNSTRKAERGEARCINSRIAISGRDGGSPRMRLQ